MEPVQRPAHLHRIPHLGHGAVQGLVLWRALRPVGQLLVGNMVAQFLQQGLSGPAPADLRPRLIQIGVQPLTSHRVPSRIPFTAPAYTAQASACSASAARPASVIW